MPEKDKLRIIANEWNNMDESKKKAYKKYDIFNFRFGRTALNNIEENILRP